MKYLLANKNAITNQEQLTARFLSKYEWDNRIVLDVSIYIYILFMLLNHLVQLAVDYILFQWIIYTVLMWIYNKIINMNKFILT